MDIYRYDASFVRLIEFVNLRQRTCFTGAVYEAATVCTAGIVYTEKTGALVLTTSGLFVIIE